MLLDANKKAQSQPLKIYQNCLLLNPVLLKQNETKSQKLWLSLYRIEKTFSRSNHLIHKVGSNYTQFVHRLRLRPIDPQCQVEDIEDLDENKFERDPSLGKFRSEPDLFDQYLEENFFRTHTFCAPKLLHPNFSFAPNGRRTTKWWHWNASKWFHCSSSAHFGPTATSRIAEFKYKWTNSDQFPGACTNITAPTCSSTIPITHFNSLWQRNYDGKHRSDKIKTKEKLSEEVRQKSIPNTDKIAQHEQLLAVAVEI